MILGGDKRCGLDFLDMEESDQELAVEVLERAMKMRKNEMKYQARQIVSYVFRGKADE